MQQATLTELRAAWLACKQEEQAANARRLEIEEQIVNLLPGPDEATVNDKESGISVTYRMTRSVDTKGVKDAWGMLPDGAKAALTWKASLDTRQWRHIQTDDKAAFQALARFVTAKPAKPSVSIKEN